MVTGAVAVRVASPEVAGALTFRVAVVLAAVRCVTAATARVDDTTGGTADEEGERSSKK